MLSLMRCFKQTEPEKLPEPNFRLGASIQCEPVVECLVKTTHVFRVFCNLAVIARDYSSQRKCFKKFRKKIFKKIEDPMLACEVILSRAEISRLKTDLKKLSERILIHKTIQALAVKVILLEKKVFTVLMASSQDQVKLAVLQATHHDFLVTVCEVGLKFQLPDSDKGMKIWFESAKENIETTSSVETLNNKLNQMRQTVGAIKSEQQLLEEYTSTAIASNKLIEQQQQQIAELQKRLAEQSHPSGLFSNASI